MTFKELIEGYACKSGVNFCRERDFDFDRVMEDAHLFNYGAPPLSEPETGRRETFLGLRVTVEEAVLAGEGRPKNANSFRAIYDIAKDAADAHVAGEATREEVTMLHTILLLEAGVEL